MPAPMPDRDGVPPARLRMPTAGEWGTVADFLADRTGQAPGVRERIEAGQVLLGDGTVVGVGTAYRPGDLVFLHRDLPVEHEVPGELRVLHRDEHLLVVDKPHFLATMPRGSHVAQTVLVRLRRDLGLPQLAPAHRLDRLTAGVLLLTVHPGVRAAYQELFARREVTKTYLAVAPVRPELSLPTEVRSRIIKRRGRLQAQEEPGEPNAVTRIELLRQWSGPDSDSPDDRLGCYRLTPRTGRTHQLRVHLAGLGIPIIGDPLYPQVQQTAPGDFSRPLQLLAQELGFFDPLTGHRRRFRSLRTLQLQTRC